MDRAPRPDGEPLTHWEGEPVEVWARLWGVPVLECWERIGSTNDRCRALADADAPVWTAVLAEAQSQGRGRSGSVWHDQPGASVLISVLMPDLPGAAWLPLGVGVAAARAVEAAAPGVRVGVKWPNDLWIEDRKVCGVLCERAASGVVAGVGINVRQAPGDFPADVAHRAVSVEAAAGEAVSRAAVAGGLVRELRRMVAQGDAVLEEVRRRDLLLGRPIRTHIGAGKGAGIGPDGALLLASGPDAVLPVRSGSVEVLKEPPH